MKNYLIVLIFLLIITPSYSALGGEGVNPDDENYREINSQTKDSNSAIQPGIILFIVVAILFFFLMHTPHNEEHP